MPRLRPFRYPVSRSAQRLALAEHPQKGRPMTADTPDPRPVRGDLIDEQPFTRRVYVRTPPVSHHLTVWHVRRWVEALDEAGIPDDAMVNARKASDTLHLVELSAHREDVQ